MSRKNHRAHREKNHKMKRLFNHRGKLQVNYVTKQKNIDETESMRYKTLI